MNRFDRMLDWMFSGGLGMLAFVVVFTVLDLLLALAITAIGGLALMALGW